jgi:hypothetical protein
VYPLELQLGMDCMQTSANRLLARETRLFTSSLQYDMQTGRTFFLGSDFAPPIACVQTSSGKVSQTLIILDLDFHDDKLFQLPGHEQHLQ